MQTFIAASTSKIDVECFTDVIIVIHITQVRNQALSLLQKQKWRTENAKNDNMTDGAIFLQ